MVGSALIRALRVQGYENLLAPTSSELNLIRQAEVETYFDEQKPEYIFIAAARVGGIYANSTYPADFIYENLQIQNNLIQCAHLGIVKKLLFLGSSCIYPKFAPQPMREESLLTGPLEPTNEAYAIAKIAGLKMCEFYRQQHGVDFISAMPTNLYGPGDNYDPINSHVIPGLIRRFHEAKVNKTPSVTIWGTGEPMREFLYVDDLADACIFLMERYSDSVPINIGSGEEITIKNLATLLKTTVEYEGEIVFDTSKPDGTPRKLLDSSRLRRMGWQPKMQLTPGLKATYGAFGLVYESN